MRWSPYDQTGSRTTTVLCITGGNVVLASGPSA
jgi:hypothetical protein